MKDGVPRLAMDEHLKERLLKKAPPAPAEERREEVTRGCQAARIGKIVNPGLLPSTVKRGAT